jgi:signal transduction histidine kinase
MTQPRRVPDERIVRAPASHRERQLAAAERIARVGSWEWEIATNRVAWSDELYRIYGLDPAAGSISFDSYLQHIHPDDRPAAEAAVKSGFETGEPFEFEHRIIRPDGTERLLIGRGEVIRDEHGVPVRMVGTGQDITRQRAAERQARELERAQLEAQAEELEGMMEELEVTTDELARRNEELRRSTAAAEEARQTAEDANRVKAQFLAAMSHELRTPLNAIAGYCELLAMELYGPVTEQQRDAVVRVQRNQRHLLALINDVLNFARLEADEVRFDVRDVAVDALLAELDVMIEPQVLARGQLYTCRGCGPELTVRGDAERIEQILVNLLSNAIKYTPAGGSIAVGCQADAERVRIHVADTGCGIEVDKLETIFEPFVQISGSSRAGSDGVGLGLAICRDLARAMAGEVEAASEPGRGSIFTLVLPRGRSLAPPRGEEPSAMRRVEPHG